MNVSKAHNFGNPYIGLFAKSSEKLTIADVSASEKLISALSLLKVPVKKITFGGSGLPGLFVAMNSYGVLLPSFCTPEEINFFKSQGLNVEIISGEFSAIANNLAVNDFGAIINPEVPKAQIKKIEDCLGVEVIPFKIANYLTCGSCVAATNCGFLVHNRASPEELKELKEIFKVDGINCTLNKGVPFISLCFIGNSYGALVGLESTGFEVGKVSEIFR
jgi:translation initiation factor 6